MINRIKNNESGLTIVEVLVAIVISSIMLVGLASLVINFRLINARTRDTAIVNALAVKKVEELRSSTFVALVDGTYDFTSELPDTITETRSAEYVISSVSGNAALKDIEITITYNDFNDTAIYKYKTQIGELGVGQY